MVRIWTPSGCDISLGVVLDRFDPDEVIAELEAAEASGALRPGQDLLTILDPGLDPDDMTVEGLLRISHVARRIDGPQTRRSLIVVPDGGARRGPEVYIALRRQLKGPSPEHRIFPTVPEACAFLGVCDLSAEFRGWPDLHSYLTPQ